MRNEWNAILLACAALVAMPAQAGSTADELSQIEAENVVLKARLRVLETRAQIAAKQADIERYAPSARDAMPTVTGIEGVSGKLHATVLLNNGHAAEVLAGDTLSNGMRVVSIRHDGVVVLGANKKRVRLKPADEPDSRLAGPTLTLESPAPMADRLAVMPPLPARPGSPR